MSRGSTIEDIFKITVAIVLSAIVIGSISKYAKKEDVQKESSYSTSSSSSEQIEESPFEEEFEQE